MESELWFLPLQKYSKYRYTEEYTELHVAALKKCVFLHFQNLGVNFLPDAYR